MQIRCLAANYRTPTQKQQGQQVFSFHDAVLTAKDLYVGRINLIPRYDRHHNTAAVNLTSIRESDTGWYECRVMFPNRTPSYRNNGTWFHLAIEGGSLIKIPPINQTIMEGQTAFFSCVMKQQDTSRVEWFKSGTALLELDDLAHRSIVAPDGSLSIAPTLMSDLGEYVCVVHSFDGDEQSASAFLNIQCTYSIRFACERQ